MSDLDCDDDSFRNHSAAGVRNRAGNAPNDAWPMQEQENNERVVTVKLIEASSARIKDGAFVLKRVIARMAGCVIDASCNTVANSDYT